MPNGPGKDVGCNRIPLDLASVMSGIFGFGVGSSTFGHELQNDDGNEHTLSPVSLLAGQ